MNVKGLMTTLLVLLLTAGVTNAQDGGIDWNSLSSEQQQVLSRFADSWSASNACRAAPNAGRQ